mgnify:CR=1 FL=1
MYDVRNVEEKRFSQAFRGYDTDEVDDFLDELVDVISKSNEELASLRKQVEELKGREDNISNMEKTLRDTLMTAHKAADELIKNAKKNAEEIIANGEATARKSYESLTDKIENAKAELKSINQQIEAAKKQFRDFYKKQIAMLDGMGDPSVAQTTMEFVSEPVSRDDMEDKAEFESSEGEVPEFLKIAQSLADEMKEYPIRDSDTQMYRRQDPRLASFRRREANERK